MARWSYLWKRVRDSAIPPVLALTALNLAICWRLFKVEYTNNFASIEGAFIAMARYMSSHWGDFSWWPLWHCGMPYQDTYVPLLHLVVAITVSLGHLSAGRAYHSVIGATYALGPAMLYLMAVRLGASRGAAFLGALFYSLFSPSALLMPDVARDIGGLWFSRRLQVLTVYGEGPHISAMTMIPVVILALENVLRRRTGRALALAAMAFAVVFLTNVPGTMALGLAVFCWICAQPAGRRAAAWALASAASALAYGAACFGVPPSSLRTVVGNVGPMHHGFTNSLRYGPLPLLLALAAVAGAGYLLARCRVPLVIRFAVLYFALTALLVLTARGEIFELLPQAGRLHLEMEMGPCVLFGLAGWALYSLVPRWLRPLVLVLCLPPLVIQFQNYRARARIDINYADLAKRSEYTTARWLDANLHGQRIFAGGSTAFWLNAFSDTPQLMGCCDQGLSMAILADLPYLINTGVTPEKTRLAVAYMRALGVDAMVANGPESTDEYKDMHAPERFGALLPVLHRENGDTIYALSPAPTSLAHVLRPGEAVPPRSNRHWQDPAVVRYAQIIGDASRPAAQFQWLHGGQARIHANLRPDDLLSVQVAWFPGWKVSVNGRRKKATADGLGFLLIAPECQGNCEIALQWMGPGDLPFAAVVSGIGIGLLVVLWRRKKPLKLPGAGVQ
jgi:hypothetical protein